MQISFDTHEFVKTLESKGFSREQAEGLVDILKKSKQDDASLLMTRQDFKIFKYQALITTIICLWIIKPEIAFNFFGFFAKFFV
jgi:hypothetical protein